LNKELINLVAFLNFQIDRLSRVTKANPLGVLSGNFQIKRFLPTEPVWIEMDTDKMTQVIDNIVGNALKYSPKGGEIDIRLTVQENSLTITVSDEGMGIPQADLSKIFKRFYRVDEARNSQTGGTGLGLAIVKDIIKLHGGTVEATSEGVGLGTTFTITLPYTPDLMELDDEEDWDE
jgi:two-component system sensor histidine kinase VicK